MAEFTEVCNYCVTVKPLNNGHISVHFKEVSITGSIKYLTQSEYINDDNDNDNNNRQTDRTLFYVALHLTKSYFAGSAQINNNNNDNNDNNNSDNDNNGDY